MDCAAIASLELVDIPVIQEFVPKYGDCLALLNFCKKVHQPKAVGKPNMSRRKTDLLRRLKLKFGNRSSDKEEDEESCSTSKRQKMSEQNRANATRDTRALEFCWFDCTMVKGKEIFVQVKDKSDGGKQHYKKVPKGTLVKDDDVIPVFFLEEFRQWVHRKISLLKSVTEQNE